MQNKLEKAKQLLKKYFKNTSKDVLKEQFEEFNNAKFEGFTVKEYFNLTFKNMQTTHKTTINIKEDKFVSLFINENNPAEEIVLFWERPIMYDSDKNLPVVQNGEPVNYAMYVQDNRVCTAVVLSKEAAIATHTLLDKWVCGNLIKN